MTNQVAAAARHPSRAQIGRVLWQNKTLILMCLPAIAFFFVFCYMPMPGMYIAFVKYNYRQGIFGSPFVGLRNFKFFFRSGMAAKVIYNTLYINIFNLILGLIIPIALAIAINEIKNQAFKKVTQSLMFFPYFLSWVVVGAIVYGLFSSDIGLINSLLVKLGKDPVRWYAEPKYWKWILILADVWKWSGYNSIIYLAAMSGFDLSMYEAAQLDGASKWQQIRYLTLPLLKPTAVVLTLMSVGRIFYGDMGMVYGIVGNNPVLIDEVTVIDTYVYQTMRTLGFSYSTAVGLMQSVMGLILVTLSNKAAKKINDGEGLF